MSHCHSPKVIPALLSRGSWRLLIGPGPLRPHLRIEVQAEKVNSVLHAGLHAVLEIRIGNQLGGHIILINREPLLNWILCRIQQDACLHSDRVPRIECTPRRTGQDRETGLLTASITGCATEKVVRALVSQPPVASVGPVSVDRAFRTKVLHIQCVGTHPAVGADSALHSVEEAPDIGFCPVWRKRLRNRPGPLKLRAVVEPSPAARPAISHSGNCEVGSSQTAHVSVSGF